MNLLPLFAKNYEPPKQNEQQYKKKKQKSVHEEDANAIARQLREIVPFEIIQLVDRICCETIGVQKFPPPSCSFQPTATVVHQQTDDVMQLLVLSEGRHVRVNSAFVNHSIDAGQIQEIADYRVLEPALALSFKLHQSFDNVEQLVYQYLSAAKVLFITVPVDDQVSPYARSPNFDRISRDFATFLIQCNTAIVTLMVVNYLNFDSSDKAIGKRLKTVRTTTLNQLNLSGECAAIGSDLRSKLFRVSHIEKSLEDLYFKIANNDLQRVKLVILSEAPTQQQIDRLRCYAELVLIPGCVEFANMCYVLKQHTVVDTAIQFSSDTSEITIDYQEDIKTIATSAHSDLDVSQKPFCDEIREQMKALTIRGQEQHQELTFQIKQTKQQLETQVEELTCSLQQLQKMKQRQNDDSVEAKIVKLEAQIDQLLRSVKDDKPGAQFNILEQSWYFQEDLNDK